MTLVERLRGHAVGLADEACRQCLHMPVEARCTECGPILYARDSVLEAIALIEAQQAELASLRGMVPVLSREELVTLRQWFHVVQDTNPGYLEEKDGVLAGKISSALSALPHPPASEGEK